MGIYLIIIFMIIILGKGFYKNIKNSFYGKTRNVIYGIQTIIKVIYDDGWGLIRCSNTTSCIVLRFEADNKNSMNRIQSKFRDAMLKIDKNLEIPF